MVANVSVAPAVIVIRSVSVNIEVFLVAMCINSFGWSGVVSYVGVQGPAPPTKSNKSSSVYEQHLQSSYIHYRIGD